MHHPQKQVPAAAAIRLAEQMIADANGRRSDVFGETFGHVRRVTRLRRKILRAVAARWPNCSVKSIGAAFGLHHSTVLYALGRTKCSPHPELPSPFSVRCAAIREAAAS